MPLAITITVSVVAIGMTLVMLGRAVANYNPGSWETVMILGGWDAFVYAGIVLLALGLRYSPRASWTIAAGAAVISGFSVCILYADLSPYFTSPAPALRAMNCYGPLIELGLPVLQWGALGVVAVVAGYSATRCSPPPRRTCRTAKSAATSQTASWPEPKE